MFNFRERRGVLHAEYRSHVRGLVSTSSLLFQEFFYENSYYINRSIVCRYRTDGNPSAQLIKKIIDLNEKQIIAQCQKYLNRYENGNRPSFSTNIDLLLSLI